MRPGLEWLWWAAQGWEKREGEDGAGPEAAGRTEDSTPLISWELHCV